MKAFAPILEVIKVIVGVFNVAAVLRWAVFQPFIVDGSSMEPNFHNNEYIIVEKVSYHFHAPRRGDVIVLEYPGDTSVDYIKRIIGLPGETVKIANGNVYINNKQLNEPYLAIGQQTTAPEGSTAPYTVTLGANQFFMMGDNRDHSSDSRDWGVLDRNLIIGRAALVLYPTQDFHDVVTPSY